MPGPGGGDEVEADLLRIGERGHAAFYGGVERRPMLVAGRVLG
jgi:hypothetical protein